MHSWQKAAGATVVLCIVTGSSALAQVIVPPEISGVPGPIAGAGLPFLLLAGGYALIRRYRHRNRD